MNATVYLACRNPDKAKVAAEDIKRTTGNPQVECLELDLASFASVRAFCSSFDGTGLALDILINNAGLVAAARAVTEDGFEKTLQVPAVAPH